MRAPRAPLGRPVIAEQDQLGPGRLNMGGEADEVDIIGHPHFVEDHGGPFTQAQLMVVEPPEQAGQGPRLSDLCSAPRADELYGDRRGDELAPEFADLNLQGTHRGCSRGAREQGGSRARPRAASRGEAGRAPAEGGRGPPRSAGRPPKGCVARVGREATGPSPRPTMASASPTGSCGAKAARAAASEAAPSGAANAGRRRDGGSRA